ncbi:MAG: MerR family transcriptional regulator [Dorea sp.]
MRINQVEELVGISKKNIRFYEEKGLLSPKRTVENGYRDYSDEDVKILLKVKLLRQLSIPIEEILKLQKGYLTLDDCMRRHIILMNREEENIRQNKVVCAQIETSGDNLSTIDTQKYFSLMSEMEKEGVRFMNVKHVDRKRKAPIIAAIVMIVFMVAVIGLLIWAERTDPIPIPFLVVILSIPIMVIVGVLLALKERMKQIEGGEEDAASKY